MKRTEQPAPRAPVPEPYRTQTAGLYGEVAVLPVGRTDPAAIREPKTFL